MPSSSSLIAVSLMVVSVAAWLAGCASNDEAADQQVTATLTAGAAFEQSLGGLSIRIESSGIGAAAGQIPPNARMTIATLPALGTDASVVAAAPNGVAVAPGYSVSLVTASGGPLTDTVYTEPYRIRLFADPGVLAQRGHGLDAVRLVHKRGSTVTVLTSGATLTTDERFITGTDGWVTAQVSRLGQFVLMSGGTALGATTLTGGLNEVAGFLAYTLTAANGDSVALGFAATALATLPATLVCNPASFNTANPTAATNRSVIVTVGGVQYTSFNTGGAATITVLTRSAGASTGTIVGTVVSSTNVARSVNYTFSTAGTGGTGPTLALEGAHFPIAATATDAHAVAATFNGTEYVAFWLGNDGATGRVMTTQRVSTTGTLVGAATTLDPAASLSAGTLLSAAHGSDGTRNRVLVVGHNAADATGAVHGLLLDQNGAALSPAVEFEVAPNGSRPRVAYNGAAARFVIAFNTETGVSVASYDTLGMQTGAPLQIAAIASARVAAVVAAGTGNEVLVTYTAGNGVKARRLDASNLTALGSEISLGTAGGGGAAAWSSIAWLVGMEAAAQRSVVRLSPGSDTVGSSATILLPGALVAASGGSVGAVFADSNTIAQIGTVFSFQGVTSGTTAPTAFATPLSPQISGQVQNPFHDAVGPFAIASNGAGRFLVVGSDRDGTGVTAFRMLATAGS